MPAIIYVSPDSKPWTAAETAEFWSVTPWIFLSICAFFVLLVFVSYLLEKYDPSPKSYKRNTRRRSRR